MAFLVIGLSIPSYSAAMPNSIWDLDTIYPDEEAWLVEHEKIVTELKQIGLLSESRLTHAAGLAKLMAQVSDARGRAGRMAKVGILQSIADTSSEIARQRRKEGMAFEAEVERSVAFLDPMLRKFGERKLRQWMTLDPKLATQDRRINRILRLAPYAPAAGSEAVGPDLDRASTSATDFYESLIGADLGWPSLPGQPDLILDPGKVAQLRRSAEVNERRNAQRVFFKHLERFRDVFAVVLSRRFEADLAVARYHGLIDPADVLLVLKDAAPEQSHRILIDEVKQATPTISRAARVLRRVYDLTDLSLTDLGAPVPGGDADYSLERVRDLTLGAVAPLGSEYVDLLRQRLDLPWLHLDATSNKSGEAGVFWQVGGGHPHGVFTFRDDFASARTYCGAAVLMMGYSSVPDTVHPDRREEDLPIFGNSLWYLGQLLLADAALQQVGRDERIAILSDTLIRVMNAVFGNALIAEFETVLSDRIRADDIPDGTATSETYLALLNDYYGGSGIVVPTYMAEAWMANGTMFSGAHHASWALAMSTALVLRNRIYSGDQEAIAAVRDGIGRSNTHFSADILVEARVRLDDPFTYRSAIDQIEILIESLEQAVAGSN
jgi:oligoendopeptidase F